MDRALTCPPTARLLHWLKARTIRFNVRSARCRVREHSQTRKTVQPFARSVRETARSRWELRSSFARQKPTRDFGILPCRGHPCQKQPSTKTATRCLRKTKSGLPASGTARRQPVTRCSRSNATKRSSVLALRLARTFAISALRFDLVRTSAMNTHGQVPDR